MIVDVHAHFLPPTIVERVERGAGPDGITIERVVGGGGSSDLLWRHGHLEYPLDPLLIDVGARVHHLDDLGIDVALLSIAPDLFFYEAAPAETAAVCRAANDDLIHMTHEAPGRLFGLASVPLNDPTLASAELRRVSACDSIVGVAIGTSVNDLMLDDPSFDPFYHVLAELQLPLLLHPHLEDLNPLRFVSPGLDSYFLTNTIGNPLETARAASRLILGGVLDRHPALTIQLVHGGGHFLYQLGRMDHAYDVIGPSRGRASAPPSRYLDRLLFDTVVFERQSLEFLLKRASVDRVTFGTDLPFAMADTAALDAIDGDMRDAVLGTNAARAYRLDSAGGAGDHLVSP